MNIPNETILETMKGVEFYQKISNDFNHIQKQLIWECCKHLDKLGTDKDKKMMFLTELIMDLSAAVNNELNDYINLVHSGMQGLNNSDKNSHTEDIEEMTNSLHIRSKSYQKGYPYIRNKCLRSIAQKVMQLTKSLEMVGLACTKEEVLKIINNFLIKNFDQKLTTTEKLQNANTLAYRVTNNTTGETTVDEELSPL